MRALRGIEEGEKLCIGFAASGRFHSYKRQYVLSDEYDCVRDSMLGKCENNT